VVMQIGEVAARADLSFRSLRYRVEVGLLRPSGRIRRWVRLYAEADIEAVRDPAGVDRPPEARERLEGILAEATWRRERLKTQLAMADAFISQLNQQLS
jgi:hypothetical protein